jgi:hypothetical protein
MPAATGLHIQHSLNCIHSLGLAGAGGSERVSTAKLASHQGE